MDFNKLFPKLYNNNVEMNSIKSSENYEFKSILELEIETSFKNNFIKTADEDGILKFEKLLDILANPSEEDLDFRRQRLYNRLISNPLYTERYLQSKLNEMLGEDNWNYIISYNDYTLDIYALRPGKIWLDELNSLLTKIMPCNIKWTIHVYTITWQAVYENTNSWQDLIDKNLTWEQVLEGEWISE